MMYNTQNDCFFLDWVQWLKLASNRNEYWNIKIIMFMGSKVRWVRKADNLTAIYEPIV
jgi:hypothetical protein